MSKIDLIANSAVSGPAVTIPFQGRYIAIAQGTFTGATVTVAILGPDGVNYQTVPNSSQTAPGAVAIELPAGATVKGIVAGGTPAGLYLSVYGVS